PVLPRAQLQAGVRVGHSPAVVVTVCSLFRLELRRILSTMFFTSPIPAITGLSKSLTRVHLSARLVKQQPLQVPVLRHPRPATGVRAVHSHLAAVTAVFLNLKES